MVEPKADAPARPNDAKWARVRWLRERKAEGRLSDSERSELADVLTELDDAECRQLAAGAASCAEIERMVAENAALRELAEREKRLRVRLRAVLREARKERRAIEADLARIRTASPRP